MIEEPPSTSPESNKGLGFFKKIRLFLRGLYKRVSYTPMNQKELSGVLKEAEEMNLIDKNILDMMEETLEFSSMQVRDVMIPRPQMIVVRYNEKPKEFLPRIIDSSHSRFPVVDEDSEEVKGILLAKELLPFGFSSNNDFNLEKVMRPVNFIPESKKLDSLLEEFRKKRYHMAIVVDEYGSVSGLVTIEDILEEIVGEIEDETDIDEEKQILQVSDNEYLVPALTELEDFNDQFNTEFIADDFDTIGGIVLKEFARFPALNESVDINGYKFTVVSASRRQIKKLRVKVTE